MYAKPRTRKNSLDFAGNSGWVSYANVHLGLRERDRIADRASGQLGHIVMQERGKHDWPVGPKMRDESVAPAEVTPGTDFCDSYLSPECCRKGRSELSLEQAKESGEQRVEPALKGREVGALFVVIATYNEKENVKSLIEKILALEPAFHVLIVDDNSPDGTGRIVQQLADENNRVHLLARPAKLGYGSAAVAGFNEALRLGARAVFSMDADHSHDPLELPRLAECLEENDVVIGSRYVGGIRILNWSLSRMFLSLCANRYVRTILRLPYTDCTSGFRGYRREALEEIPWESVHSSGYSFLVELLHLAVQNGRRVCEAPIVYTERRAGQSKMSRRVVWESLWRPWILLFRQPPKKEKSVATLAKPPGVFRRWATWTTLCAILILATFLRFHVLAQDPFWVDEIITARTTQRSWKQVFLSIRQEYAAEAPAQIVIGTVLYRMFGRSVWVYRSIPATIGVLGVLGVFLLGRRLLNARLGLLAALLIAIMPYNIRYSQEFRGYAALACFSAFTAWAFVRAVSTERLRDWLLFGLVAGVSLLFHHFVMFVILAAGAYSFLASLWGFRERRKKSLLVFPFFCLASVVALAIFSPWLVYVYSKQREFELEPVFRWDFVWATLSQLAGSNVQDGINMGWMFWVFYAMVLLGVVAAFALAGKRSIFLLLWMATAPLVFWIISLTSYFFSPRQSLYLQPLFCVLVVLPAEWVCTMSERYLRIPIRWITQGVTVVGVGLLLAISCWRQLMPYYVLGSANKFLPLDDMGDFIAKNAGKDDVVVFDWEPYIFEYHCGREDVKKLSEFPKVLEKGKPVWLVNIGLAGQKDPFVAAHPPSVKITCSNSAISYYSPDTSFSLAAFLAGLSISRRGAEAASIGFLWEKVSPKAAQAFFESVNTSTMNRRTLADFYCYYGNLFRGIYFRTGDKDALQKAIHYLGEAVRSNPYSPYLYTYYADALLYADQLKESCLAAERGVRLAGPRDVTYPASTGFRSAFKLLDSRRVFEFGALLVKYEKDPKTRQAYLKHCQNYCEKHPETKDLCYKIFKRHGLDPGEIME